MRVYGIGYNSPWGVRHLRGVLVCLLMSLILSGCSSKDDVILSDKNDIKDPVSFKVHGISGELFANVSNELDGMNDISSKRAHLFVREIRDNVQKVMHALGYYHPKIKIDLPDDKDLEKIINVHVDAGKPLYIRDCTVNILGEGAYYSSFSRIIAESGLESYTILNHGKYENLKSMLRSNAMSLGFFDAKLVTSHIMVYEDENVADIELIYDTGKRYSYGKVLSDTRSEELLLPSRNLFTLDEGKPFSSEELKAYSKSLSQTNYYSSVDVRPLISRKTDYKIPLEITVEKQKENIIKLGLGYSTDEQARVLFSWDKPMLNSLGHSLSSYSRLSAVKQDAQILYKIPRNNPNLDFFYFKLAQIHTDINDTLSDLSHASFHYVSNSHGSWRRDFSLSLEYEDYKQGSEKGHTLNLMPGILLSRYETSGGIDPHTGYSIKFELTGGAGAITDYDFLRLNTEWKGLMSPTPDSRLFLRAQYGAVLGHDASKVPPSKRFFAGGINTIRGYGYLDESPRNSGGLSGGIYMATGTAEYQFPSGFSSGRIALFLDAGYVSNKKDKNIKLLLGPGIGYRYISKYGTLKVDVAYGCQNDSGFKLHVAFGPEF